MPADPSILNTLKSVWGYDSLRPLQERAIEAVMERRDSLVVMPTGGGKSLCYQLPPLIRSELTVVVSPLIALMKDQVDSLRELGVEAWQVNSTTTIDEKRVIGSEARRGSLSLLFVSPERLANERFQEWLQKLDVRTFAIDEAHCISHWGHDFRPEYRQLGEIRARFPRASIHAYTATATERVRRDIVAQLGLFRHVEIVGSFDRPNLSYRVLPKRETTKQVLEVIERHSGEAGIIYCLRKSDVDELAATLQRRGIDARPYHAGLSPRERSETQDAFASERCNLVVATIAFGMGIDRSNIRFVLHTALPKSIEHYQQETGRAGRDGLEADCVLLYSARDTILWRSILEKSAAEFGTSAAVVKASLSHVEEMDRYARGALCRHRALVQHFGESWTGGANCSACDLCLGDVREVDDAAGIAQKILSCVVRLQERFGGGYVASILRGERSERAVRFGHDALSTFGLLADRTEAELRDWITQLVGHGALAMEGDPYPVLRVTPEGWSILRGQQDVRLIEVTRKEKRKKSKSEGSEWEGVDRSLFESLREWRRALASSRNVPPYVILGDRSLREIARLKPVTLAELSEVYGIGERKLADLGPDILRLMRDPTGPSAE